MSTVGRIIVPGLFFLAAATILIEGLATGRDPLRLLEYAVPLVSTGAAIWFFFFLWRAGHSGDTERNAEAEARAYFAEHGRWPDEPRPDSDPA